MMPVWVSAASDIIRRRAMKSDREEFEKWASALPRDLNINRLSASASWPEQYESYTVETAWEAWQAAPGSIIAFMGANVLNTH